MSARPVTMTAMTTVAAAVPSAMPAPASVTGERKRCHDQHKGGKNREQVCAHIKIIADSGMPASCQPVERALGFGLSEGNPRARMG